ncbi:DUF1659 domain-containing protein [Clostridium fermenticellae]|uniref:DUF1659 domain-containing protein n=1 Tax=Clostridium fermenticellae TaxID=2068654 RepID=A0A386H4Z6_9CLOT|nr:DUF1659 domain-containing protein [Clostridium fermenticellae]AYD40817.1 DUF1659 domain-containing protein [Clostridium fermenticellae]
MAAKSTKLSSTLSIVEKTGLNKQGKEILKKVTLGKIAMDAADQDVYDVVKAIGDILTYPVNEIQKVDNTVITNA